MTDFFRFPHTPHLAWLGEGSPRDDKVMSPSEVAALLAGDVVVEEKLDGANLGLSLAPDGSLRAQNRGQYLTEPHAGQFARLPAWLAQHDKAMRSVLTPNLILFGEWCAARHSLDYAALPDWFLLFDVFDLIYTSDDGDDDDDDDDVSSIAFGIRYKGYEDLDDSMVSERFDDYEEAHFKTDELEYLIFSK